MDLLKKYWPVAVLVGLLLGVLAAWGSREHSHTLERQAWSQERTTLSAQVASLRSTSEDLRRESETTEEVRPVEVAGQIAYVTTRTSKTVETALKQARETIDSLTAQVTALQTGSKTKETEVTKSAPLWNVEAGMDVLAGGYDVGGGMNLGPISVTVTNPAALEIRPHVGVMLRF